MASILVSQLKDQILSISLNEKLELLSFIENALKSSNCIPSKKSTKRVLGGLEKDFWIASDFDETPECFKDYM